MNELEVTVSLSNDQALVLSDWLDRMLGTERFDGLVGEEPAVWSPIHRIAGSLETRLPEIFAGDYTQRLERARQRLLLGVGQMPRRSRPHRASGPVTDRAVSGWVEEEKLVTVLERLSAFVNYRFDGLDEVALIGALEGTEDEDDRWFEYPLQGLPPLTVCLARQEGCSEVVVVVRGGFDDVLAARIETLLDLS